MDKFELPPPSIRQINIQASSARGILAALFAEVQVEVVTCVGALLAVLGMGYAADVRLDRMPQVCTWHPTIYITHLPNGTMPATCFSTLATARLFPAKKVLTRPSYTCMAMLLSSYAILIPGTPAELN